MPRKREVPKREPQPDPRYGDKSVAKFINYLMYQGKKSLSEKTMFDAMDLIQKRTKEDPLKVFKKALDNVRPMVEVRSRRVGGSTYQVPTEVRPERRTALAMRWLISFSRSRAEKTMADKLANEIIDAFNNRGNAVKKREDTHKMAEANKAFSHYRW
jgi:small subunit ribosomal protein S7